MSTVTPRLGLTKPAGIEQFNLATYNGNLDLIDAYAANIADKKALGAMPGSKSRASASAAVSALSVIENIASIAFKGGRKYKIVWDFSYTFSVLTDIFTLDIQTCLTTDASSLTTGLTTLTNGRVFTVPAAGQGTRGMVHAIFEPGADTTLQVKFTAARTVGSGTFTMEGNKSFYFVEDLGAQY